MSKLIITIESDDPSIAELLIDHPFASDNDIEIKAVSSYKYYAPKTKPYFTCPAILDIIFNFHFEGITELSKIEEFDALKKFCDEYVEFAKRIAYDQERLQPKFTTENLSKNAFINKIYQNLMNEERSRWERTSHNSPQFFISNPEPPYIPSKLNAKHLQEDKSAQYFLMAGLGLCLASGVLYFLAPLAVCITALVLGIGLISWAALEHQKINASRTQEEAIELLPCTL